MKRKNIDKKEYGYQHTKQRLLERYTLEINREEYYRLCSDVKTRKGVTLVSVNEQKKGIQLVVRILFKGVVVTAVWEENRDCVTTVL